MKENFSMIFIIFGVICFFFGIFITICACTLLKRLKSWWNCDHPEDKHPVPIAPAYGKPILPAVSNELVIESPSVVGTAKPLPTNPFEVVDQMRTSVEFEMPFLAAMDSLFGCSHDSFPRVKEVSPWKNSKSVFPLYGTGTTIWYLNRTLGSVDTFVDSKVCVRFHESKDSRVPQWFLVELLENFTFRYTAEFGGAQSVYLIDQGFQSYRVVMDMLREIHLESCRFYSPLS